MRPRRRFAQHFLEPAWVTKVAAAIDARPAQAIVEIGAGRGALTEPLAATGARLLAVEVDRDLATRLERDKPPNVTVLNGDVLTIDVAEAISTWLGARLGAASPVRVVGNLPYNISSPILFRLFDLAARTGGVTDAVLMLQKEVADRLAARVGTRASGVLTILTALHADASRVLALPPGAFRPAPKVHSALIRLVFRPAPLDIPQPDLFVRMVRSMFTTRRKTLQNALRAFAAEARVPAEAALRTARIDRRRRPETLRMDELAALWRAFAAPGS
jgi:16S rRNA (adenine1518-N6/adenine1519-N6)-dimethyltransferase